MCERATRTGKRRNRPEGCGEACGEAGYSDGLPPGEMSRADWRESSSSSADSGGGIMPRADAAPVSPKMPGVLSESASPDGTTINEPRLTMLS